MAVLSLIGVLAAIAAAAVGIYVLVLTIQLLERAIRALDIYLAEKEHERYVSGR